MAISAAIVGGIAAGTAAGGASAVGIASAVAIGAGASFGIAKATGIGAKDKKEGGAKQVDVQKPSSSAALDSAKTDTASRRRGAALSGAQTDVTGFGSAYIPTASDVSVKTLLGQ